MGQTSSIQKHPDIPSTAAAQNLMETDRIPADYSVRSESDSISFRLTPTEGSLDSGRGVPWPVASPLGVLPCPDRL